MNSNLNIEKKIIIFFFLLLGILSGDVNRSIKYDRRISITLVSFKMFLLLFRIYNTDHQSSFQKLDYKTQCKIFQTLRFLVAIACGLWMVPIFLRLEYTKHEYVL